MTGRQRLWLGLLVLAVTINALVFARINPDRIVAGTDSPQYDVMARQLAADRGFTDEPRPPFDPTLFREPGYPLLVATLYRFSNANVDAVVLLQAVLLGLTAGLTALMGARLFGVGAGLLGGALFGLSSESAHYAHWLLTEIPFTFLLTLTLVLALRGQASGRLPDFVACGVGLALAAMVRVIALALLVPLLIGLYFSASRHTRRVLNASALAIAFVVVLGPWLARNVHEFGQLAISTRTGATLIRRAPRAAEPPSAYRDWVVASVWMAANPLSNVVYPISRFQWGPSYEDNLIWDFHVNDQVRYNDRYAPVCRPQPDEDACYAGIGWAFVRAYPVGYVLQSVFAVVTLLFAPLPGPQALIHNGTVWLGLISGVVLAWRRRLGWPHALVLLALGGYVGASIVVDTQVRYLLPVLPIFAIFGAAGVVGLVSTNWRNHSSSISKAHR